MTPLDEEKAALRAAMRARREAVPRSAHDALNARLIAERFPVDVTLAAFWPLGHEPDLRPFLRQRAAAGGPVALPVMTGADTALRFHLWTPDTTMRRARFGVCEPQDTPEGHPQVILTPLLAFDRSGGRLGYGGGFYDRSFAARPKARRIGIAFAVQEVPAVPTAETDVPLHAILTDTETICI